MVRTLWRRPAAAPLALAAALVAAEVAVLLLRPRTGVLDPLPVEANDYFTAPQIERAEDYRGPQPVLLAAGLVLQAGLLVLVLRRPARLPSRALAAGAVVSIALAVVTLPLSAVSRQRAIDVGLVTQSWGGWAGDVAKSVAISAVLAGLGAALASGLARRFGTRWWLPGSAVVVLIGAGFLAAGPVVLDPLFNRFTPLPAGELRSDVLELAERAGVDVGEVYEMDASRRTTAANAYVTGLGSSKRVVLYDTLLDGMPREQVRLVVAHELAHVQHGDLPRGLLYLLLVAPIGVFAVTRLTAGWAGNDARRFVPALALAIGLVSTPVAMVSNQLSRRVEARADTTALELTGDPEAFVAFQRDIAVRNVSDPEPPGWRQALLGTHPTTVERIGLARAYTATTSR
jgi:STE24 endopeptidase